MKTGVYMERSPKRNPYGGSRFSYGSRPDNRTAQSRSGRYDFAEYTYDAGRQDSSRRYGDYGRNDSYASSRYAYSGRVSDYRDSGREENSRYSREDDHRYGDTVSAYGYGNYQNSRYSGARYQNSRYSGARYQNARYSGARFSGSGSLVAGIIDLLWRYRFFLFLTAAVLAVAVVVVSIMSFTAPDKNVTLPYYTPAPSLEAAPAVMTEQTPAADAVPTEAPTPAPTATPAPRPTMVAEYQVLADKNTTDKALGLVQSARVDDSYFNDTIFVGDSVSKKLEYYIAAQRKNNPTLLGDAKFLTAQSFSARNALRDVTDSSIHPTYQGQKMKLEDAIAAINPKRVYIMLGMNDVGVTGVDTAVENMIELLKQIKKKSPNVQIFVQSATPRVSGSRPTTEQLFEYNVKLYEYCRYLTEYDIWFVDVAHVMRDPEGKLYEDYCSDLDSMALHFTNEGCRVWVEYLYTHALADN